MDVSTRSTKRIYRRDHRKVDAFLRETKSRRRLTEEDYARLCPRVRSGDLEARDAIVEHNLPFVVQIVRQYQGAGLDMDDLMAWGAIGLIKAANRYDYRRAKFTTLAVWWIKQEVLRALSRCRLVRMPTHRAMLASRAVGFIREYLNEHGKRPDFAEVAEALGADASVLEDTLRAYSVHLSLSVPKNPDDNSLRGKSEELGDVMVDPDWRHPLEDIEERELFETLAVAIERLPPADAQVINLMYGRDGYGKKRSLDIVGRMMGGISRQRVQQIHARAIQRLSEDRVLKEAAGEAEGPESPVALKVDRMIRISNRRASLMRGDG